MKKGEGNVPMTDPGGALAIHDQKYFHSVSWVELNDGKVLMSGCGEFRISEDGGISWGEPFQGKERTGGTVSPRALVKLSGGAVGMVTDTRNMERVNPYYDMELLFRLSEDEGKTWSDPVVINPKGPSSFIWQDMLCRTCSGRIILPTYIVAGQGSFHQEGAPFAGGYVNGNFVSTDAHFYDPHFSAAYIFYSDDDGKTWQRNQDGELFVILEPGGQMESCDEASVTEVSPGKLLMIVRTRLGRYYQAWSNNAGETWTRPQPTQLAGTQAPAQIRTFRKTGHLLIVFTQQSEEEIRKGFIRTRLSSAVSRNGGRLWEHFQNVESLHEETHVEPGPIHIVKPEGRYLMAEKGAGQIDPRYVAPLPVGYGRWSYPSVLVLDDRVLISHTYTWHDETGAQRNSGGSKLKILPVSWFYGGQEPGESEILKKIQNLYEAPQP